MFAEIHALKVTIKLLIHAPYVIQLALLVQVLVQQVVNLVNKIVIYLMVSV